MICNSKFKIKLILSWLIVHSLVHVNSGEIIGSPEGRIKGHLDADSEQKHLYRDLG